MFFTTFPILSTERLTLRQLSMDDRHDILALRSDPAVNQYLDRPPSRTLEEAAAFIGMMNDNITRHHALYWAITLTETRALVGTICLWGFSSETSSCEIGYELRPAFQGQGMMQEAMQAVLEYVFQTLKLDTIRAHVHVDNRPSAQLLSKFHFIKTMDGDVEHPHLKVFVLGRGNGV